MSKPARQAFTLIQLVAAVIVIAVIISAAMHLGDKSVERPAATASPNPKLALKGEGVVPSNKEHWVGERFVVEHDRPARFTQRRALHEDIADGQGPLLARVVRQIHPQISGQQVDELLDTLPPGESPRLLLLPSTEKPVDEDKSCRPEREPVHADAADAEPACDENT